MRQLTNASQPLTLAKTYQPYGPVLTTAGAGTSSYGFTGEWTDASLVSTPVASRVIRPKTE